MTKPFRKIFLLLFLAIIPCFIFLNPVRAADEPAPPQDKVIEAVIITIKDEHEEVVEGRKELYQKLELLATTGDIKGKKIIIDNGDIPTANTKKYRVGDKVLVNESKTVEGKNLFYIVDYIRNDALNKLFLIFVAVTVLIGTKRGIASLLGMGFSFLVIFLFILPQISSGRDPIFIAILASIAILPVTFYLSHGINRKTTTALVGTFIALILTGLLANTYVEAAKLSGFASEEASYVELIKPGLINIKGLLLAGIIISVLGILDDITISQAAVVYQLKEISPALSFKDLYLKAMDVGRDHIASVVNTLVLVYTGASLPLLILFINNPVPFGQIINHEIIAEEIVRTLVASIGLILAVPITTFITAQVASWKDSK